MLHNAGSVLGGEGAGIFVHEPNVFIFRFAQKGVIHILGIIVVAIGIGIPYGGSGFPNRHPIGAALADYVIYTAVEGVGKLVGDIVFQAIVNIEGDNYISVDFGRNRPCGGNRSCTHTVKGAAQIKAYTLIAFLIGFAKHILGIF